MKLYKYIGVISGVMVATLAASATPSISGLHDANDQLFMKLQIQKN